MLDAAARSARNGGREVGIFCARPFEFLRATFTCSEHESARCQLDAATSHYGSDAVLGDINVRLIRHEERNAYGR